MADTKMVAPESSVPVKEAHTYGLDRDAPARRHDASWVVHLSRRGRIIKRSFADSVYGSSEAAYEMACRYRDAVLAALPPRTNREQAVRLQQNNPSGIAGVYRKNTRSGPVWQARLTTKARTRKAQFSVRRHGEATAKALAITRRRQWLAELPARFLTRDPHADDLAREHFPDRLDHVPDIVAEEALTREEFNARLAEINALFDALRPPRLRVRVSRYDRDRFAVFISDCARPAHSKLHQVSFRRRPLRTILADVKQRVEATISAIHDTATTSWFMREHGNQLLDPKHFDAEVGFTVTGVVPHDGGRHCDR